MSQTHIIDHNIYSNYFKSSRNRWKNPQIFARRIFYTKTTPFYSKISLSFQKQLLLLPSENLTSGVQQAEKHPPHGINLK